MDANFYFNSGITKMKNGDFTMAIDDFTNSINLSNTIERKNISNTDAEGINTSTPIIESSAGNINMYFNRACCFMGLGQYKEAISDFSIIIEYDQNDPEIYFQRAIAFYAIEMDDESLKDINSAQKIDPEYSFEKLLSVFGN
jgi:tetratricopeptide (TPR) repeat protein